MITPAKAAKAQTNPPICFACVDSVISFRLCLSCSSSAEEITTAPDITLALSTACKCSVTFVWIFSFIIDLLAVDFRKTDNVEYIRTKSKNTNQNDQRFVITIPEAAKPIIKEWMNKNTGRLDFGYKFTYSNFSRYLTRCIAALANQLGISQKVVYYSARKSFAQFASELGIPDGVIDYCLGHSTKSKGVIRFYTKVKQKQAEIASTGL